MIGTLSGDTLTYGQGKVYRDGSLGCVGCAGIGMATGPGASIRDGSLGMAVGPGQSYRDGSLGQTGVSLSGKFLAGLALGALAIWLYKRPPKFLRAKS